MILNVPQRLSVMRQFVPGIADQPVDVIKRCLGLEHVVKLSFNENPLGPSPRAVAAAIEAVQAANRYPAGPGEALREAIAAANGVQPDQVILSNGADDMIGMTAQLLEPGEEAVIPTPTFGQYAAAVQAAGGVPVCVPLAGVEVDLGQVAAAVTPRTRLVFLCNPNNPTGRYIALDELKAFAMSLPARVTLVVDEAYFEYVSAPGYGSAIALLGQTPCSVVVIRTFSKIYALAGLRVGYGLAAPETISVLERVRLPFNVNAAGQAAALASLNDTGYVRDSCAQNAAARQELVAKLQGLRSYGVEVVPGVANFLLVQFPFETGDLWQALLQRGVVVRRGADVGFPCALRVTVGLPAENELFVNNLATLLAERK